MDLRRGPCSFTFALLRRPPQCGYFLRRQLAKFSRLKIQLQRTIRNALDFLHMVANGLKHPADLPVLAFNQRDFIPRIVGFTQQAHFSRRRPYRTRPGFPWLITDADSMAQLLNIFFLRLARDLHQISLRDVRIGAREKICELAVVGEDQQAFAVEVEAADGIDAFAHMLHQVHDRWAAFRIGDRCYITTRLVERKINVALRPVQQLAIYLDVVSLRIGFAAQLGYNLAVHGYAPASDQLFRFAA